MRLRNLVLNLDGATGDTLVRRIADALERAIREGRLRPGTALPGSRTLAQDLGVARNTLAAALDRLVADGWLVSEPWRGTFVAPAPPVGQAPEAGPPAAAGFDLPSRFSAVTADLEGVLDLREGRADPRLVPLEELGQAYRRALTRHGGRLLGEGEPQGNQLLREVLAGWMGERHGVPAGPEQILVTGGARMALQVACAALLKPGACVGVEEPGNRTAWEIIRRTAQAELRPLAVDAQGLVPEALEAALRAGPMRMVYTTPRRQYPTGAALPAERAERLLALAAEHRLVVFEDDSDGEIRFGGRPEAPLLARDRTGQVLFAGSLARILAPGANLGFLVAPAPLIAPMARIRRDLAARGDRVLEWAIADFIRDGGLARHLRRVVPLYAERRNLLAGLLGRELGPRLEFRVPDGGLAMWLKAAGTVDLVAWVGAARQAGVLLHPPGRFFLGPPQPCTRLGFAHLDPAGLQEAVRRLKQGFLKAAGAPPAP